MPFKTRHYPFMYMPEVEHLSENQRIVLWMRCEERLKELPRETWRVPLAMVLILSTFVVTNTEELRGLLTVVFVLVLGIMAAVSYSFTRARQRRVLQVELLDRGIRPAHCFTCRYDLRGSKPCKCPECGEALLRDEVEGP